MTKQAFVIRGTDKRKEYIEAIEAGDSFITQKAGGKDVEHFDTDNGFLLIEKDHEVSLKLRRTNRVLSIAKLSLGARLSLREFYYAMRNKHDLLTAFEGTKDLYKEVLSGINSMEVFCDLDRKSFTIGNFPKGLMFYAHSYDFGQPEKLIGMTENLARDVLEEWEVRHAINVIHLEKLSAAVRLIKMGFSELTNSLITTTGGNFTRAVYALANRFHEKKEMIFFCDGDAYGYDMLRALEYGTKASRHMTPFQAFSESTNPKIHIAGLFPSIAERLGIPNDLEQKRPMQNPHVKARIAFLQRYGLVDSRDLATWQNNQTFELEGLSTQYESTIADKDGEFPPIGLGIYLIEYMRLRGIPCKPQPTDDDDELLNQFEDTAKEDIASEIEAEITDKAPLDDLKRIVTEKFNDVIDKISKEIYEGHIEEFMNEYIKQVTADELREKIAEQYQNSPKRERYSLKEIVHDMKAKLEIDIEWNIEKIEEQIENAVKSYIESLPEDLSEIYTENIEFTEVELPEDPVKDFYDVALEEIGARPEDCEAIREALEWRLK